MDSQVTNVSTVSVNGRTFVMEKMPATKALLMQARIVAVLSPVLSELPGMMSGKQNDPTQLGALLMSLVPQIDVEKTTGIVIELCESCRHGDSDMKGQPVLFDISFNDDLISAYELAVAVADFNFGKYVRAMLGNENAMKEEET